MATRYFSPADPEPMAAINITPLIDVLLVLLIMLLITLPVVTHKVPLDLPQPGAPAINAPQHRLDLARDGVVRIDGALVSDATLPTQLRAIAARGEPLVVAAAGDARYARFDSLLATIKRAGITRLGFADNAQFAPVN